MTQNAKGMDDEKQESEPEFISIDASWRSLSNSSQAETKHLRSSFQHSDLSGANFSRAELEECDLSSACLDCANLEGMVARRCNFSLVSLREANLRNASFSDCTFTLAVLISADLEAAVLTNCDLSNALILNCTLRDASLAASNCSGARFNGSSLTGANLDNVILTDAILSLDQLNSSRSKEGIQLSQASFDGEDIVLAEMVRIPIELSPSSYRLLQEIAARTRLEISDLVAYAVLRMLILQEPQSRKEAK